MSVCRAFSMACVLLACLASAAFPAENPNSFGMSDLAQLLRAGIGDTVIIAKVNAATELRFDTSDAGLKQLREIGVSTAVLRAITDRKLQLLDARPAAPSVSKTAATPTQPGALPSAAGVYYDNSGTYQALTQAVGHQASASGGDVAKETAKETGKSWLKQKVLSAIHIYGGSDPTAGMRAAAAKAYHTYDGPDAAVKTAANPRFVMVGIAEWAAQVHHLPRSAALLAGYINFFR